MQFCLEKSQNWKKRKKNTLRIFKKISLVYTCKQPQGPNLIYLLVNSCLSFFHLYKVYSNEWNLLLLLFNFVSLALHACEHCAVFVSWSSQICLCARRRALLERFAADSTEVGAYSAPIVLCLLKVSLSYVLVLAFTNRSLKFFGFSFFLMEWMLCRGL